MIKYILGESQKIGSLAEMHENELLGNQSELYIMLFEKANLDGEFYFTKKVCLIVLRIWEIRIAFKAILQG